MSNEGTYAREELRMDQGQATGISTSNRSLAGTSGFGLDEIISNATHPTASLAKRSRPIFGFDVGDPEVINNALQQQERHSAVAVPQIFPPFVGEIERNFQAPEQPNLFHVSQNTLHPQLFYQLGNMEMGPNYGGYFPFASPTAQGTVTSLGNGNYHLPTSNFTAQLHGQSSSSVQLSPTQESCPLNPLGGGNGAPAPCFPTTQWTNNPNLQQPHSQLSTGLGASPEMMQSRGLSSFSLGGRSSNNESQSSNTQQKQGPMGNIHPIPNPREMGESSSRNVKMKMTLPDNSQQSTELIQAGSLLDLTTQGNGNPQPPRLTRNSLYDPMYEQMGFPVDPHLRMFLGRKRRQM